MPEKIEGRVAELLEAKNFAQVATTRKDGSPHVTPVWVDHDGEHVVLNTAEGRAWPANARRTGKIAINVANQENPYEYVYIQGTVAEDTHRRRRRAHRQDGQEVHGRGRVPLPPGRASSG